MQLELLAMPLLSPLPGQSTGDEIRAGPGNGDSSQSQAGGRGPVRSGGHRCVDLCLPGSSALRGPGAVQGWERGSLTMECRYDPGYETYRKWWCRGAAWGSCRILVQTSGSEQEVRRGRVSIRDHQENRTFTVTLEELRLDDADTYWCGIERAGTELVDQVEVTVDQGKSVRLCGWVSAEPALLCSLRSVSRDHLSPSGESHCSSQLSSVHFWLPVLLKVPLLLSLLGAVLWVCRPQRGPRDMEPVTLSPSMSPQK
ncbi:CMRF35-like molecule 5 [Galemys pyrenaicus]|uniref:CMRF35-like molecule 5 n=1 Tax=Galemys pyrenaicus TaxID=202257 RepID=A0A8J6DKT7_GALPY|nr:CMRF35-like molecule 5 [Galemys pyrenaicus]